MRGWLYLIKNGDLYKIGVTKNFENRMRQLKPDIIVAKLYSNEFMKLERELHKRYKDVRIPQSEYFRLGQLQVRDVKQIINNFSYPISITYELTVNCISFLVILFLLLFIFISFTINDMNEAVLRSFLWMERFSFVLSILSLFIKSKIYLSFFNELKYRTSRLFIFILFAYFFRIASRFLI